jgi:hypothetical protein
MSIGGSKGKSKSSQETSQSFTQNTGLNAAGESAYRDAMARLEGQNYQKFDPGSVAQYFNPYQQDVIDSSVAQINREGELAGNQQRAEFAQAGAFGDKRQGVYEAELAGNIDRNRSSTIANLMQQGYSQAQAIAQAENQNQNAFSMTQNQSLADLLARYMGANTTTSGTSQGLNKSTGSTSQFGFSWAPKVPGMPG